MTYAFHFSLSTGGIKAAARSMFSLSTWLGEGCKPTTEIVHISIFNVRAQNMTRNPCLIVDRAIIRNKRLSFAGAVPIENPKKKETGCNSRGHMAHSAMECLTVSSKQNPGSLLSRKFFI